MPITVNIYYKGENGSPKKFAQEMLDKGLVDLIRSKEGNLRYEYFLPLEGEDSILLIDQWKNQEDLDLHHASPVMNQIIALRDKYGLQMEVERYVDDENGIPEKDEKFIRK
ncbi:putative quinol monooxygenase [Streptococcaceae bacterium ESL0687]|nr:putative quinol monooxygenase [Streptococcaceae bacterium ESL0687]